MRQQIARELEDLVVRAQLARLEHADQLRPIRSARGAAMLGGFEAAATEANALGLEPADGPAATFFAFGRRAYLFPSAHRSMTFLLTAVQARSLERRLAVGDLALERMIERLVSDDPPSFGQIQTWLLPRLTPRHPEDDERLPLRAAV